MVLSCGLCPAGLGSEALADIRDWHRLMVDALPLNDEELASEVAAESYGDSSCAAAAEDAASESSGGDDQFLDPDYLPNQGDQGGSAWQLHVHL